MRSRWWLATVALLVALSVLVYWSTVSPVVREGELIDGTVLRFERAFIGTTRFDTYSRVKSAVTSCFPSRFQSRFGERFQGTFSSSAHQVGLIFSVWPKATASEQDSSPVSRVEFIESTGHRFQTSVWGRDSSSNFFCVTQGPYPRRDPILHLRCYEEASDQPVLDVKVPNPGYQPSFTEWSPEAIPITKTQEPLTVTLKRGPQDFFMNYLRSEDIEIVSTDASWTDVRPQPIAWMSDATGNRSQDLSGLSPYEPAWKLNLRIRRNPSAPFSDNEVWRTEQFPVPTELSAHRLNLQHVVSGIELGASFVSSAGVVRDDGATLTVTPATSANRKRISFQSSANGRQSLITIDSGSPFIRVTYSQPDDDTELILIVRDQTGRLISFEDASSYGANGVYTRYLQFIPTEETKQVRLEAIVNRGRTFEFFVKPYQSEEVPQ